MTVYVITHKKFDYVDQLPVGYIPMMVGANVNGVPSGYLADNTMKNISDKNSQYCELTGLYWMWKNSNSNKVGLAHYRRFFYSKSIGGRFAMYAYLILMGNKVKPATVNQLDELVESYDWVVAHPEDEGGKNLWLQFNKANHEIDMQHTREVIAERHPDYLKAFDKVMHSSSWMSPYNMFYTKKEKMDQYCEWLFDILFEVEKRTEMTGYTDYQKRLYGFLSERLLNVWLEKHKEYNVKYLTVFKTDDLSRKAVIKRITNRLGITKGVNH
ncbi:DUF4422 domain-containing protein [Limosilactobacillus reuteri]|uniref:DUF4422 domain-containing protein n=1 Tax=Limosilactobacillus reuteri TaxID=1598 RepID=UPI001E343F22|nr:DUF4422 domain-containing protein [Limosilactobacillus reuteri]MCC4411607.1 DUF4422 domain-containing protein [Limosilactobacillus reuteri]